MTAGTFAYVDASAFVKLVVPEPESDAMTRAIAEWPRAVSSALLTVEVRRAGTRAGADRIGIERALAAVTLLPVTAEVRERAAGLPPPGLRTLEALHLASALLVRTELGAFFAYDRRLADAAAAAGLEAQSPQPSG